MRLRPAKTLFVSKININENEILKNEIDSMFDDPKTYLTLPSESKYKYVIGRQLKGPRYDKNKVLIPYTYVGKPFQIKTKKKVEQKIPLKRKFSMSIRKPSKPEIRIENINNDEYVSTYQLEYLFNNYRRKIKENKKEHNSFINEIPPILNDSVKKNLLIQEKTFEKKKETENFRESFKRRLENKNKRKEENILLLTTDNFRERKELHNFFNKNEDKIQFGNSLQSWTVSLRKPKKFVGTRNGFYNCGNDKHPFWAIYNEISPHLNETIKNPKSLDLNYNETYIKNYSSRDFEHTVDRFLLSSTNLKELEVHGKNLLNFENDNLKLIKGKKKIVKVNYDRESVRDHVYCNTWKYNGYNTLS